MNALTESDIANMDYTQIGGGSGVIVGIVFGMHKRFSFGKTALFALIFGAAGAFIGYNIQQYSDNEK